MFFIIYIYIYILYIYTDKKDSHASLLAEHHLLLNILDDERDAWNATKNWMHYFIHDILSRGRPEIIKILFRQ